MYTECLQLHDRIFVTADGRGGKSGECVEIGGYTGNRFPERLSAAREAAEIFEGTGRNSKNLQKG